jgi:hypothetical protein
LTWQIERSRFGAGSSFFEPWNDRWHITAIRDVRGDLVKELGDESGFATGWNIGPGRRFMKSFALNVCLMAFCAAAQGATTYYASPTGNDNNNGTSTNSPFKTLGHAAGHLAAGDTLYMRGGIYPSAGYIGVSCNGTPTARIKILPYPGDPIPVIDWSYYSTADYLWLSGSNVDLCGLEIRNSGKNGLDFVGRYSTVSQCKIHNNMGSGVYFWSRYQTFQGNTVYSNCLVNYPHTTVDTWPAAVSMGNYQLTGNIIRGNTVYNNWGEGINLWWGPTNNIVEDNVSYDNFAANYYLDGSSGTLFQRNISYLTAGHALLTNHSGLFTTGNEVSTNVANNNTIINNLFFQTSTAVGKAIQIFPWSTTKMTNLVFANNTIVNVRLEGPTAARIGTGNLFVNNIFGNSGNNVPATGITWSNNLWSGTRPANAVGIGDIVGQDPRVAKTGLTGPGQLTANYFKLLSNSPAINAGSSVAQRTADYFGLGFVGTPDMGAMEYGAGITLAISNTASGPQLRVAGWGGTNIPAIYASTNLVAWTSIYTSAPAASPIQYLDSTATNAPTRVYRASIRP